MNRKFDKEDDRFIINPSLGSVAVAVTRAPLQFSLNVLNVFPFTAFNAFLPRSYRSVRLFKNAYLSYLQRDRP